MRLFFILIAIIFFSQRLTAGEAYLTLLGARNEGEHIFETGNMHPNLSGIRGGSRITYNRDYNFGGLEFGYLFGKQMLSLGFRTTGWNINPGNSRDEDFVFPTVRGSDVSLSRELGSKFSLGEGKFYDTAHTYSGTINFADGHTRSAMSEYALHLQWRYYFGEATPFTPKSQFFLSSGVYYSYFKYYLYDVVQYINSRPIFYGPIGNGLSYAHSYTELPLGLGYAIRLNQWTIEPSVEMMAVFNRFRDFHVQRALNFIGTQSGPGFRFRLALSYLIGTSGVLKVTYHAHRQFTRGQFETRGGLSTDDILSNFLGNFNSYVSTKQAGLEFSYSHKLF
ncbi:MAG: putative porin [Spirochaetota bacterium]